MERRQFLRYLGAGAAALGASQFWPTSIAGTRPLRGGFAGRFQELAGPLPRPGQEVPKSFVVQDELVVPKGFRYRVLAAWGDVFGPIEFGTNCDFTALVPRRGKPGRHWLVVNHEYISLLPWLQGFAGAKRRALPEVMIRDGNLVLGGRELAGLGFDLLELRGRTDLGAEERALRDDALHLCREALNDLGLSILEVEETAEAGGLAIVENGEHRRITAERVVGVARSHRPRFSGPAKSWLGAPLGTISNCSGGVSSWGHFFSCEENYQDYVDDAVTASGELLAQDNHFGVEGRNAESGLPRWIRGLGQGGQLGLLDGRHYGWVVEIDPETGRMTKHLSLGRFRHENVALAARRGQPLAAYMGDDRRGGHVWKFVSRDEVREPAARSNTSLLEVGRLHVAQFEENYRGRWIPLDVDTPLRLPEPARSASSVLLVPERTRAQGGARKLESAADVDRWVKDIERFTGKTFADLRLGDLVVVPEAIEVDADEFRRLVILMDAFLMANCVGGTPSARPEDLECEFSGDEHLNVFVSFTDFTPDGKGGPDRLVFPESVKETSRRYGAIHHLAEDGGRTDAMEFSWGILVSSGELHEGGGGFAAPDNLALDPDGELWLLTDMSAANAEVRSREVNAPGDKNFMGIFGNNAMFWMNRESGRPECFAYGPVESELTGPTFFRDQAGGTGLLISVQHPGEINGRRGDREPERRRYQIADLEGSLVEQERSVPIGSSFAAGPDGVPRSAICLISRQDS